MSADRDHGPIYPALPQVEKWRRKARAAGSVAAMSREERKAYGEAVLAALRSMNAPKGQPHRCPCASGTWHSEPRKILAAVKAQNRSWLSR